MRARLAMLMIALAMAAAGCGIKNEPQKNKEPEPKQEVPAEKAGKQASDAVKEKNNQSKAPAESKPEYRLNDAVWSIKPIDDKAEKKVVLVTIDDAPDKHAVDMAKTLKKLNVPAIFFVNGHFLDSEDGQKKLKEIHDLDFVIGNHTYSHASLPDLSESKQKEEILKVNEQIEKAIGMKPSFFRAPFGQNTEYSRELAKKEGMTLMNWTYGYDWNKEYMNKDAIENIMVNAPELQDGANLLMHDREWTDAALEGIIKGLEKKGYKFADPKRIQGYHGDMGE